MTDTLRTRICAALEEEAERCGNKIADFDFRFLADAVITELGLRVEFGALDDQDSGVLYVNRDDIRLFRGETIKRRYITEWEPDG